MLMGIELLFGRCQMTKTKQFSNELDVIYSRENNLWIRGIDWKKCNLKLRVRVYLANF